MYAKTKARRRRELWSSIYQLNQQIQGPWSTMGDFNVIMEASEKKGGRRHRLSSSLDFINRMIDAGYIGNQFTWTNGRRKRYRVLKSWTGYFTMMNGQRHFL